MGAGGIGDWNQNARKVLADLHGLKRDVRCLTLDQAKNTLEISTEIAALKISIETLVHASTDIAALKVSVNHQARFWGLAAGAVPALLILLISKLLN